MADDVSVPQINQEVDIRNFQSQESKETSNKTDQVSFVFVIEYYKLRHVILSSAEEEGEEAVVISNMEDADLNRREYVIGLPLLLDENRTQACVENIISSLILNLTPENLDFLKTWIAMKATTAVHDSLWRKSKPVSLFVAVQVRTVESYVMAADGGLGVVPASRASIDALRTLIVQQEQTEETCSICLQQLLFGEKVTEMPCLHVFHKECIVSWLGRKNTCPLCRFELPIET